MRFDGLDDRVEIEHTAALGRTTGMTLEAWVRPTTGTDWRTVVMKARSGGLS